MWREFRPALLLLLPWLHAAAAALLRRMPDARGFSSRARLPNECSHCQGIGVVDPFTSSNKYCKEHYDVCTCCRQAVEAEMGSICGQFAGYGSCVAGIQAAIREKEKQCENQQAVSDWNKNQQKQQVNDALGDKSPFFGSFVASAGLLNSTGYVERRFDTECAADNAPSCDSFGSLCAHDSGCNSRLQQLEMDYVDVKGYYGLYRSTPCFSR
mmetsp:Transcript_38824/g.120915  ORF Transcript_38824/g.120915 Transcript_38824/m.120915 type:complete len:212 (-) Transcript_38824:151-786(-)